MSISKVALCWGIHLIEALPRGGMIAIETGEDDGWAQIVFRDTSIGMDEDIQRRAFEPFFTTNTITRWGGTIEIADSAPGKGTKIVLRLPPTPNVSEGDDRGR